MTGQLWANVQLAARVTTGRSLGTPPARGFKKLAEDVSWAVYSEWASERSKPPVLPRLIFWNSDESRESGILILSLTGFSFILAAIPLAPQNADLAIKPGLKQFLIQMNMYSAWAHRNTHVMCISSSICIYNHLSTEHTCIASVMSFQRSIKTADEKENGKALTLRITIIP